MFLTKKHLSRRTLLKGAGVSVALPLLDAMIPAATALAQTAAGRPPLRAGFFYIPHGAIMGNTMFGASMDQWTPSGSGADFTLNTITKPLEPIRKHVISFNGLKNDAVASSGAHGGPQPNASGKPIHATQPATWLSGMAPDRSASGPSMGATLDQVIAARIGQGTPHPSLQVASETTEQAWCKGPYSSLSFRDATTSLPMEYNPRKIFIQLFGEKEIAAQKENSREDASLLDLIREQTRALQQELGPGDRAVLDSHLTAVREAEQRLDSTTRSLQNVERAIGAGLPPMPAGVQQAFDEQVNLIFDLILIAYTADLTRVVSFIMAAEGTNQTYNHIGVPESFHPLSHHANQQERILPLVKIQTWHMERFAEFAGRLANIREGDRTLLDNAMLLYGSNMSNSDKHSNHPLPTLLVGGAGGKLTGGRHIALPEPTPIANLHLTLLGLAGIEQKRFGDSTGTIAL